MPRPKSIADIARRVADGSEKLDPAIREFIDTWDAMPMGSREAAIREQPAPLGTVRDAYLAALGEHLALTAKLPVPDWTNAPERFLSEPFFAGGLEALKSILLVESPLAFRRRLIFISADGLSRPHGSQTGTHRAPLGV